MRGIVFVLTRKPLMQRKSTRGYEIEDKGTRETFEKVFAGALTVRVVASLFTEQVVVLIVVLIRVIYVCYPFRLTILRKSAAYSQAGPLPSKNVLQENERHPSIIALPLRGDYWLYSWSGRLVTQLFPKIVGNMCM